MARHPAPLPDSFQGRSFAVATARAHGIPRSRTRAQDLLRPHRGIRSPAGVELTYGHECAALQLRLPVTAAFSHVTAARLHDLPLPSVLESADVFHVVVPRGTRAPRGKRVCGHQSTIGEKDVDRRKRVPATTPERTFCDLASMLTLGELVAIGDVILRRGGRAARMKLAKAVAAHPARKYRLHLKRALELLNPKAESPKESELRVLLIAAGFPAPAVNHVVYDVDGTFVARIDLTYPGCKVAIEYDGDQHRTDKKQWRTDLKRRRRLEALGWKYLTVTQADLDDHGDFFADLRTALIRPL
ncbi:DUF559 domain-containing protein [Microbacterium kribbense]|uniref:DUF559 domain-containing protein n=1 Tax=Microbacterium kribbense TaxID=433645 RepID=A0ABP7G108_9MICO